MLKALDFDDIVEEIGERRLVEFVFNRHEVPGLKLNTKYDLMRFQLERYGVAEDVVVDDFNECITLGTLHEYIAGYEP